ncbi:MAG: hypothetical protein U9N81_05120 [Bacillota bacterium]|nr:hypothetical protein [Bacillota bacterium]
MTKRIIAIIAIFLGVSVAWMILGSSVNSRTIHQDVTLREEVGQLWGSAQRQKAPQVWNKVTTQKQVSVTKDGKKVEEMKTETYNEY